MASTKEKQAFTVDLELTDWRRLKAQAADERRPMISIVRDSLRIYLDLAEASNGAKGQ